ncbi:hypothetical protein L226DRAFT_61959 [Lentinus tigrinus ALCF2SS1-7]|uniref:uncharacterized protein n=1 Tax=Lentinus tigrinus ALCF2SS1-7 TaxID=1328758 RepID=UPI001165F6BA|nr:hypothetical protein L226DRAFT_61959 [Lentinus tigrinus ALCF2SS1-7]
MSRLPRMRTSRLFSLDKQRRRTRTAVYCADSVDLHATTIDHSRGPAPLLAWLVCTKSRRVSSQAISQPTFTLTLSPFSDRPSRIFSTTTQCSPLVAVLFRAKQVKSLGRHAAGTPKATERRLDCSPLGNNLTRTDMHASRRRSARRPHAGCIPPPVRVYSRDQVRVVSASRTHDPTVRRPRAYYAMRAARIVPSVCTKEQEQYVSLGVRVQGRTRTYPAAQNEEH